MMMTVNCTASKPVVGRQTATPARSVRAAATDSRRNVLLGGASLFASLAIDRSASAFTPAIEVCDPGADGKECREKIIADSAAEVSSAKAAYGQNQTKFKAASGIAMPDTIDEEYAREIFQISDKIQAYISADPFDKQRLVLKKEIGDDGNTWIAKYAKGGSVRSPSGRKFYVVIDAMKGWFASNGVAPLPRQKANTVLKDIEITKDLLAAGK